MVQPLDGRYLSPCDGGLTEVTGRFAKGELDESVVGGVQHDIGGEPLQSFRGSKRVRA